VKDIVIIGAGGLGREVAWLIEDINKQAMQWNLLGFVDDSSSLHGTVINGYPVLGNVDWLKLQRLNAVMAIGNPITRKMVVDRLDGSSNTFPVLVHPSSIVSPRASLGMGTVIFAGTSVSVDVSIGQHVLLDRVCTVAHDVVIEDCCAVLPGTNLSGNVKIEQCVSVGANTVIIQGITVGARTIIGAGAVVIRDLPHDCTAVGSPAKPIK